MSSGTLTDNPKSPAYSIPKRPSSPLPQLERPTKRLQLGPTSSNASTLLGDNLMGSPRGKVEDEDTKEGEEVEVVPKRDKGKGKAKVVSVPDLPQEVWTRIFEFLYTGCEDQWVASNTFTGALTPLLLSKEHTMLALPVLYRHPHINHQTISRFINSIHTPARYTDLTKIQLIKHLTIRPSPAIPGLEPKGHRTRINQPRPLAGPTIHPHFADVMQSVPDLTSFTLRDALVLETWDAFNLFKALSYIKPLKARLEIRMWDLYDSPVGQDLIAANKSSIHAPVTRHVNFPPTPPSPLIGAAPRQRHDGGTTLMQEAWRESLWRGGELEFPSWWIDPPGSVAAANPQQPAAPANPFVGPEGPGTGMIGQHQQNAPNQQDQHTEVSRNPLAQSDQQQLLLAQQQLIASHNQSAQGGLGVTTNPLATGTLPTFNALRATGLSAIGQNPLNRRIANTQAGAAGSLNNTYVTAHGAAVYGTRRSARLANLSTTNDTTHSYPIPSILHTGDTGLINAADTVSNDDLVFPGWDDDSVYGPDTPEDDEGQASSASAMTKRASRAERTRERMRVARLAAIRALPTIPISMVNTACGKSSSASAPQNTSTDILGNQTDSAEHTSELDVPGLSGENIEADNFARATHSWGREDELDRVIRFVDEDEAEGAEMLESGSATMNQVSTQQQMVEPNRVDLLKDVVLMTNLDIGPDWKAIRRGITAALGTASVDDVGHWPTRDNPAASSTSSGAVPWTERGNGLNVSGLSIEIPASKAQLDRTDHLLEDDDDVFDTISATVPPSLPIRPYNRAAMPNSTVSTLYSGREWGSITLPGSLSANPYIPFHVSRHRRKRGARNAISPPRLEAESTILRVAGTLRETKVSSYLLAHEMRRSLLELITHYWAPRVRALSFVALDPLASMIVRSPALDLWTRMPIPHIRVHLPRGINSLAVFKGAKECARDRFRIAAARRAEREAEVAAAVAAADEDADVDDQGATTTADIVPLQVIQNAFGMASANPLNLPEPIDEEANRVVGGDGEGGGLLHQDIKLFEIEVNTLAEMGDDVWIYCGDQFPPEVCRLLVEEHDWRDLATGTNLCSPASNYPPELVTRSPATDDYASPTFSFASFDLEGNEAMSGSERGGESGETYDAEAAREQARRIAERKKGRKADEGGK